MADTILNDGCLWPKHVGCGLTRRVLLGLEPGSRIWLTVDDEPVLFERMQDGKDGRSTRGLKPIGPTAAVWHDIYKRERITSVLLGFTERPIDRDFDRLDEILNG